MRAWLIAWLEWGLARLGHEVVTVLVEAQRAARVAQAQADALRARESARAARHALLHEAINGLMDEGMRIDFAKQGNEWKRRQLYALAKAHYPRLHDDLCALAAVYTLYYVHQARTQAAPDLHPAREDV